ncbi:hypothetical protein [Phytohabitans aurantiacus]|jgi:hypothetical protein|uniref:Uncharacterized protein n=1 Tax=Phytohabitans aurantiacus TaxID=3016789 RepID=A0ABQ5QT77_9ACTN|nr:hypothetical protein [Phytohabitans aurantiacus]GLH97414.1 hypothetical protein Pa4123_26890 [Phytohabitans aurantiacus]
MAKDKRPKDDLHTEAKARMAHMPAETAGGRLDEQTPPNRRDMDARDPMERMPDESASTSDMPARGRQAMTRADKQRNQPRG